MWFAGRRLLIVTKHHKEKVIAPVLEKDLGVTCFVGDAFDTDTLGTFTGETERIDDPVTTARKKCFKGMELYNCDLAVANEGSFGSHPTIFFATADDEVMVLIDTKNNLEIKVRHITTNTNFNGQEITSMRQLRQFAKKVQFPSHGIILRKAEGDITEMVKGINTWKELEEQYKRLKLLTDTIFAETDMRAMYNPTRMHVIETTAKKLADKAKSFCPQCNTPGFGVTDVVQGLPCSFCGFPTRSTLSHIYTCQKCSYTAEEKFPHLKTTEDPAYCDVCNP